jgi:hypothetical protein
MHSVVITKPTVNKHTHGRHLIFMICYQIKVSCFYNTYYHKSELTWFMWSDFVLKWSEVRDGEVLEDKGTMYIRVTVYWGYLIVLWLFIWCLSCTMAVLTCYVMCGCFGNTCTCIYYVYLHLLCFVLFVPCFCIVSFMYKLFILICSVSTSVRTTGSEWKLNWSK